MLNRIIFVFFRIIECTSDLCSVRVYNVDDHSYAFVNQRRVISESKGSDSNFIDVTNYTQNGLNNFTFLTYNNGSEYTWGFQIIKNGEIVFDDMEGLVGTVYANNSDQSKQNQYVYNKTVSINITKCSTTTGSTGAGEFFFVALP